MAKTPGGRVHSVGLLERWGVTHDELNEILASRPSLRGILSGFVAEYKLCQYLLATSMRITWPLQLPFHEEPFGVLDAIVAERQR